MAPNSKIAFDFVWLSNPVFFKPRCSPSNSFCSFLFLALELLAVTVSTRFLYITARIAAMMLAAAFVSMVGEPLVSATERRIGRIAAKIFQAPQLVLTSLRLTVELVSCFLFHKLSFQPCFSGLDLFVSCSLSLFLVLPQPIFIVSRFFFLYILL